MLAFRYLSILFMALSASFAVAQDKTFDSPVLDVGAGPSGAVWAVVSGTGGNGLWLRADDGSWSAQGTGGITGGPTRVAVDPLGLPWVIGGDGKLMRQQGDQFVAPVGPAQAYDIGIGSDRTLWITTATPISGEGGNSISRSRDLGASWKSISGAALEVAVDPQGNAWVVNADKQLWRYTGSGFQLFARKARDVAVAGDGTIWIVSDEAATGGYAIYGSRDNGQNWSKADAAGTRIAAGRDSAWVADAQNRVRQVVELPFSIMLSGASITLEPVPEQPTGPCYEVMPSQGSQSTSGSIVVCPPDPRTQTPIVVTGLPATFAPVGVLPGTYLCPIIGQGARLLKGCQAPFDHELLKKTNGKATYRGKSGAGASCTGYGRVAGLGYAFFDPRNTGECWACPVLMQRTVYPVNHDLACWTGMDDGIMWQSSQYPEPGLTTFVGTGDIIRLAMVDPVHVDAFLGVRAEGDAERKQVLWEQMADNPNDSAELKALVYATLLAVAKDDPDLKSDVAQKSVGMFQSYIQVRRTYIAQEAMRMYHRFLDFNAYKQWSGLKAVALAGGPLYFGSAGTGAVIGAPQVSLSALVGAAPDDYVGAAQAGAVPDERGEEVLAALADLAVTPYDAGGEQVPATNPVNWTVLGLKTAASAKGVYDLLNDLKVAREIAALTGKAGMGIDLGMTLGGAALDFVAAVMTIYAQNEVEEQYASLLVEESRPVSIGSIMAGNDQEGKNSLMMWWALATSAYHPGLLVGGWPMSGPEVCATQAGQCTTVSSIVKAARASLEAPSRCTAEDIALRKC